MGTNINKELTTDIQIMNEIEDGTEQNITKMNRAQNNIVKLLKKTNNCCLWTIIIV